jgi:hypothetical protein
LAALGGYMTAKFLWNPDYDENKAMHEFLEAYYGKAARPIRAYIDMLHDFVEKNNIHVVIWAPPASPHLTDEMLVKADALWQVAEELTAGSRAHLLCVKTGRLSVDYAIAERARAAAANLGAEQSPLVALAKERFRPFMENLGSSGVTRLREGRKLDLPDYRKKLAAALHVEP